MKKLTLILILIVSQNVMGQQYDGLHFESKKVDKNNVIYTLGKEFVFSIHIEHNDSVFYLKENRTKGFELTTNVDSLKKSEVHLTVMKPRLFRRTNTRQTEIMYSYEPNPSIIASTGIVENEENTWLHPPRNGFFECLETCPFPYIKLNQPQGFSWEDSMAIGAYWGDPLWGEWEDKLLLRYEYMNSPKQVIETNFGAVECLVIDGTASSEIGTSYLKAFYSEVHGFIRLEYTLFSGLRIELNLEQIVDGPVYRDGKDFFRSRYN